MTTPRLAVAAAALAACRDLGLDPDLPVLAGLDLAAVAAVAPPTAPRVAAPDVAAPDRLGLALERTLDRRRRRASGTFFTPPPVAAHVTALALDGRAPDDLGVVLDPAAGGGAFLLAAARWLAARGVDPAEVVEARVVGVDLDPLAALTATSALLLWARSHGADPGPIGVSEGDGLALGAGIADAVVGNPPFQSQLGRATARSDAAQSALRDRYGDAVAAYTDTAALFLLAACEQVRAGGTVCLLLPQSVLGARDARGVRAAVAARGRVERLWVGDRSFADAGVRVCAPVVTVGAPPRDRPVARHHGVGAAAAASPASVTEADLTRRPSWSVLLADRASVPAADLGDGPRLGTRWRPTAGFRDEYYGTAGLVEEAPGDTVPVGTARLLTCGLVDPLRDLWGGRPATIHRERWARPVVRHAALDPDSRVGRWARVVLTPKVVVASQTKVIEAVVDADGSCWPSVPAIAVAAPPSDLWHLAALVHAPPVSAWLWHRRAGTALSAHAISVSARDLAEVPLPPAGAADAWDDAAAAARVAARAAATGDGMGWHEALLACGRAMTAAYGGGDAVVEWWAGRLPRFR